MTIETAGPQWTTLRDDATAIAEEYQENGWETVVLEPTAIEPVTAEERIGFDVQVSTDEYELLENLIEHGEVTITAAEVYVRQSERDTTQRFALAVEHDEETATAVVVPLTYDLDDAHAVFETALITSELMVHVTAPAVDSATDDDTGAASETVNWISFSHDDPSLFLEEGDGERWTQ